MNHALWFLQCLLVVIVTLPIALLPYRLALRVGGHLGELLFLCWRSRRKIAIENLKAAVSRKALTISATPEDVIKENFRNLGRSFVEVVKIYYGLGDHIIRGVKIRGAENFVRASRKGMGTLIITGHCGNWELNALAAAGNLTKIHVVARPIDNPYLNRLVEKTRRKYGNRVIYKKGALKKILFALSKNETVVILMDQSVVISEGVMADFLGKKDYTIKTPALIAFKAGSPVLPAFIRRSGDGHIIEIGEELILDRSDGGEKTVYANTVKMSQSIEEYVRQNPAEWLWIHRRWKRISDPAVSAENSSQ
ncbi:MAG: lysophospholipid acyltransferase family protein [Thermodesulfovibrionales bacterium]